MKMKHNCFSKSVRPVPPVFKDYDVWVSEDVAVDGRITKKMVLSVDKVARNDEFRTCDFALDRLIAAGVDLKEIKLQGDRFAVIRGLKDYDSHLKVIEKTSNSVNDGLLEQK